MIQSATMSAKPTSLPPILSVPHPGPWLASASGSGAWTWELEDGDTGLDVLVEVPFSTDSMSSS